VPEEQDAIEALDRLQASLELTRDTADRWVGEVLKERAASSDRGRR
jgi:hypothetical protein